MAGGGGKSDEPQPHPPKDQLPNVSYCITSPPPWPEAMLLGFQHYLVMLGTTVIIPTALVLRWEEEMFLSPLSAVPLVALAGFSLYEFAFSGVAKCIEIGLQNLQSVAKA
ncbi:hypothetical protein QQ045_002129 [Rhodiola kirilowii]